MKDLMQIAYEKAKKDKVVETLGEAAAFKVGYESALEWKNVNNEIPYKDGESSIYCLVKSTYDGIVVRPYNEYHICWDQEDGDDHYTEAKGGLVTHWMPLPNPPES